MDRIKQALARARKERDKIHASQARLASMEDSYVQSTDVDEQETDAKAVDKATVHTKIQYTSTRKIHVSPKVLQKSHIIIDSINGPSASSYNLLRTRLLQKMRANNWTTLAITSSVPGEGKTVSAINLSISLAREVNNTVLLVDLDLRRPTVHKYLGFDPEYGIDDYLQRDTPLENILINPGIERLVILPGHEGIAHSSEMLSSPKMKELVEELRSRYQSRLILFDLPPLLALDDALAFSPLVDTMLVVIEDEKTKEDELKRAFHMLQDVNVIGTLLNKSIETTIQYGYYNYEYSG